MLTLNVVQMAHAELTSTICRSELQPSQKGVQSTTVTKVTSEKNMVGVFGHSTIVQEYILKVYKWTESTCKETLGRINKVK